MSDVTARALDDLPNGPSCGARTFFVRRGLGAGSFGEDLGGTPDKVYVAPSWT